MQTIGVRLLKAELSRVLRDVQAGERYLVTDRGRVVAELRAPSSEADATLSPGEQARLRLAASGELRLAERPRPAYKAVRRPQLPNGTGQEWLDWARGDR